MGLAPVHYGTFSPCRSVLMSEERKKLYLFRIVLSVDFDICIRFHSIALNSFTIILIPSVFRVANEHSDSALILHDRRQNDERAANERRLLVHANLRDR